MKTANNTPIEDANNTAKGAITTGVKIKTQEVVMDLETQGLVIGIRTPGVKTQTTMREMQRQTIGYKNWENQ